MGTVSFDFFMKLLAIEPNSSKEIPSAMGAVSFLGFNTSLRIKIPIGVIKVREFTYLF